MAPAKTYLRLAGHPLMREPFPYQKPLRKHYPRPCHPIRPYSSSNEKAKPRPYNSPPKPKPLVGTRTQTPSPSIPKSPPIKSPSSANPKSGGVYAPYWRISLGVVICGSLIYSMVPLLPPKSIPKLTYMHASSPPPYSSRRLPSQTETSSQSESPA